MKAPISPIFQSCQESIANPYSALPSSRSLFMAMANRPDSAYAEPLWFHSLNTVSDKLKSIHDRRSPEMFPKDQESLMMTAIKHGRNDILEELLKKISYSSSTQVLTDTGLKNEFPLVIACKKGNYGACEVIYNGVPAEHRVEIIMATVGAIYSEEDPKKKQEIIKATFPFVDKADVYQAFSTLREQHKANPGTIERLNEIQIQIDKVAYIPETPKQRAERLAKGAITSLSKVERPATFRNPYDTPSIVEMARVDTLAAAKGMSTSGVVFIPVGQKTSPIQPASPTTRVPSPPSGGIGRV